MQTTSAGILNRRIARRTCGFAAAALATALLMPGGTALGQTRPIDGPTSALPAGTNLPTQKLGANDLIAISVYGAPELTRTVRVSAEGDIRLPMLGRAIHASGLLPAELEKSIVEALNAEQILVQPIVTVTIVEYQSRPISVSGAVKNPVTFQASGPMTLLEAINRAGGLSPDAGTDILISRRSAQGDLSGPPRRVTVKALIDNADPQVNLRLTGGEEVRVPEVSRVFIVGNVKKPGSYPMHDSPDTTVLKMIAVAEGLNPYASKQAYIMRRDDRSGIRQEIRVELQKIMQRKTDDVSLVANDILYIPDNSGRRASIAALERIAGFGTATASGVIIWGRPR
jgi:polysaccharide biosynthesis/export protein